MRVHRAAALIIVLSLALGACDAAPGPTAAPNGPEATPTASGAATTESAAPNEGEASAEPSAEPVDVAANAAAALADPAFAANVALAGTTTLGKATTATTGTVDIEGRASHLVRADTTGKATVKTETIVGNSERYVKVKGVWTHPGAANDDGLLTVLRGISGMTDLGVEDKDGAQLHHLQSSYTGSLPSELALATKGVSNLASTVDAWVEEDGTPVVYQLTSTWDQLVAKKTVKGSKTATFTFSNVGGDVTVAVPTDIWAFFTSRKYAYRIAYPETWEVRKGTKKLSDAFLGQTQIMYISRARRTGFSLSEITKGILGDLKDVTGYKGIKVTSNKKTTLDGKPARRIEFTGKTGGKKIYGQAVYALKGTWLYFIGFDQYGKTDAASRDLFTSAIRSFDYR